VPVGRMMDAMARRRVEDPFQPSELGHQFGVQPELIEQVEQQGCGDNLRAKAQPDQRNVEDGFARQF
jgi:hypothetical protein